MERHINMDRSPEVYPEEISAYFDLLNGWQCATTHNEGGSDSRLDHDASDAAQNTWEDLMSMKWVYWNICTMLFNESLVINPANIDSAIKHYRGEEKFYRELETTKFAIDIEQRIRCIITTPYDYKNLMQCRMTRYLCDAPVLQFAPSTRLQLDVTSSVSNFSPRLERYVGIVGGTTLERHECLEVSGRGSRREVMSEYDSVILYVAGDAFTKAYVKLNDLLNA
ncbi:unnamed protein product, partial [Hydatigera taeniaeformis]|uniref:Uncharacterized protein n=1 Tax=Hydatigena taeniaeformis TaxID=6205 RepID=A0A0R3WSC9_HYDTA